MSPRPKAVLLNLALALVSTCVALLALEGVARWGLAHPSGGKDRDERIRYLEPDPILGWRKRPGARVTYERAEYTVEVRINSRGLRDVERNDVAEPGTFRVLALGDSFIEGYGVPAESTTTHVLEERLTAAGRAAEVINGGSSGYSTDQEYLFYREEGVRYSPQVVVLYFFYNDIVFNARRSYWGLPKPLLAPTKAGLVVSNLPLPVPRPRPQEEPPPPAQTPRFVALAWVKDSLLRGAPEAYDALARLGLWGRFPTSRPPEELKVYKRRRTPRVERSWQITAQILAALQRETESHGARLVVAYVPSLMEVDDRVWDVTRFRYGIREGPWERGWVVHEIEKIGRASHIPILDLTPCLRKAHDRFLGRAYYALDGHWNARGHRAAALEVERFLRTEGWLP